jgi:hypothetical protein
MEQNEMFPNAIRAQAYACGIFTFYVMGAA